MRDANKIFAGTTVPNRAKTDEFFRATDAEMRYTGRIDRAIRFVGDRHLANPKMWEMFVRQFALRYDAAPDNSEGRDGWRGEYFGKSMRGAVATYIYTRDEKLYGVMTEAVTELLKTQDEYGRFSSYSKENEFGNWDLWCRKYVLLGLQYYYDICRDEALKKRIVSALTAHADYIMKYIGRAEEGKREIVLTGIEKLKGLNASSILEPYVRMYLVTKEKRFLDFAEYLVDSGAICGENIYELAYEGKKYPYEYSVTKAYEMMSCFEGLLEYYRVTGNEKYKTAVLNFIDMLSKTDVTVIGSLGCSHELLDNAVKRQTDITNTLLMQETCVTVTWMKLCAQALFLTGDSKYADFIEQSAYNAMLGAVNENECLFDFDSHEKYFGKYSSRTHNGFTDFGMPFDSYSPLLPGKRGAGMGGLKKMDGDSYYGCCACIGGVGTGFMADLSFVYSKRGFAQNLYLPGTVKLKTPDDNDVIIAIRTEYPKNGSIEIEILSAPDEKFEYKLRIPAFSKNTSAKLNGEKLIAVAGEYLTVDRKWQKGDKIELCFDMAPRYILQDGFISISVGPVVLARSEEFGENIDEAVELDCKNGIKLTAVNNEFFDSGLCYELAIADGKTVKLSDYASAGKKWDKKIAAWFAVDKNATSGADNKQDSLDAITNL